ncbi:MAG: hypothetical protein H6Q73_2958 [Firmicutes bacterium]|nr:hypothetical protein [Bacillota bacterium]
MLTAELQEKLNKFIAKYELESIQELLLQHAEVCIGIKLTKEEDYSSIGNSRIAGQPDLPPEFEWPGTNKEYYTFLAQINLSEVPGNFINHLPKSGMLYFFLGVDESVYDIAHKVLYYDGDLSRLKLTLPPEGKEACSSEYRNFISYQIAFAPDYCIRHSSQIIEFLQDRYEAAYRELNYEDSQLWGRPAGFAGDARRDAYFCRNGLESLLFNYFETPEKIKAKAKMTRAKGREEYAEKLENVILPQLIEYTTNKKRHDQAIKNWQLLFKFASLEEAGMNWWDAGILQFLIDINDLGKRNFTNTYANIAPS